MNGQWSLVECYWCGRRFPELYKLTLQDVQREHLPSFALQMACGECLVNIRNASKLVPEQSFRTSIRNLSWMIPTFSIALFTAAILVSNVNLDGVARLKLAPEWLGSATLLVGILSTWSGTKPRYGFTHDIKWTLNSKRVNIAMGIMLAGLVVTVLSTLLPR